MRVTTAFSRLLRLPDVWVRQVRFEPDRVVVEVALKRRRLICPKCGHCTMARKDTRPEDSDWWVLDLGAWRLEVHCRRRRLSCSVPTGRGPRRSRSPARRGVHARLRVLGRVAGDPDGQEHDQADAADRLGHGRADHQARLGRIGPRPVWRASATSGSTRSAGSASTTTSRSSPTVSVSPLAVAPG